MININCRYESLLNIRQRSGPDFVLCVTSLALGLATVWFSREVGRSQFKVRECYSQLVSSVAASWSSMNHLPPSDSGRALLQTRSAPGILSPKCSHYLQNAAHTWLRWPRLAVCHANMHRPANYQRTILITVSRRG